MGKKIKRCTYWQHVSSVFFVTSKKEKSSFKTSFSFPKASKGV